MVEVLLYVHRNRRLIRDGSPGGPPRLSYSTWTLMITPVVECCFTSTETVGVLRTATSTFTQLLSSELKWCISDQCSDVSPGTQCSSLKWTELTTKPKIVWIETGLFFFYPGRTRLMFTCMLGRYVVYTVLLVPKPFGTCWQRRQTAARR